MRTHPARRDRRPALLGRHDVPGRSLAAVVAILTCLASFAAGGAVWLGGEALAWRAGLAGEATILVRPRAGRDADADAERAAALAREVAGVAAAAPFGLARSAALLEPWLGGGGLDLPALPVPRVVALRFAAGARPDLAGLAARLAAELPGATLDDHSRALREVSRAATAVALGAGAGVVLLLAASGLAVAFATRGVVAGNRATVEVLDLLGADRPFIARAVAARFVPLGAGGAALGFTAAAAALGSAGAIVGAAGTVPAGLAPSGPGPWAFAAAAAVALGTAALVAAVPFAAVQRFVDDDRDK